MKTNETTPPEETNATKQQTSGGRVPRLVMPLFDFRERAVNQASFYYGAATMLAISYVVQCWAAGDPWAGAKGVAACLIGKICHLKHPFKCADCGGAVGNDNGPKDGWQLEDGRTVCQSCSIADFKRITSRHNAQVDAPAHD